MSFLRSSHCFQIPLQGQPSWKKIRHYPSVEIQQRSAFALKGMNSDCFGQQFAEIGNKYIAQWSFINGSRLFPKPKVAKITLQRKGYTLTASWITASQIATGSFTFGTAAVLPFYTLMVLAPNADLTKKSMESSIPYVMLGVLYAYLLYLSWTPETLKLMFASKYWLPELPGITRMFSSEMTMASAWIHLLAVDLFAARQVFQDGLKNKIETRHSVSLCLLFCPIGIMAHVITKVLTKKANQSIEA